MRKDIYRKDGERTPKVYPNPALTEYDFDSVMHYPADAFIKDNAKTPYTIVPKDKKLANNATFMSNLGYKEHLSKGDVEQLRFLYKCYLV